MLRPAWLPLAFALAPLSASLFAASRPELSDFHCRITFQAGRRAHVLIAAAIANPGLLPQKLLEHSLISYDGQPITGLRFRGEGLELAFHARPESRLTGYVFTLPAATMAESGSFRYQAEYVVTAGSPKDFERVPLLVPAVRTPPGTRVVEIEVEIADDEVPLGDSFPHFHWERPRRGSAVLANVPAFVKVRTQPAGAVSVRDRLEDPTFLNDAFIIVALVVGSIIWTVRYRRR